MSTHIFDIDGTLVNYHTNEWLDGARENLVKLSNLGYDIILITARNENKDSGTIWSPENTKATILKDLDNLGVKYRILFNVQSGRTIYDDTPCRAVKRKRNNIWPA